MLSNEPTDASRLAKVERNVEGIEKEVDALQIHVTGASKPWYAKASVIIAISALMFSFGTTAVSYHNSSQEAARHTRSELRGLIIALTKLPIDNFELIQKYKDDEAGKSLTGQINAENSILATQALAIIDRFPDSFSSSEYLIVGQALVTSTNIERAMDMLQKAVDSSANVNDRVVALRNHGSTFMGIGELDAGREAYTQALESVWDIFPTLAISEYYRNSTDALTEMYWAQSEFWIAGNFNEAMNHMDKANQLADKLQPGPGTNQIRGQINFAAQSILESSN